MPKEGKRPGGIGQGHDRRDRNVWIYLPVLLVFVSITSFIAGTRIGRGTEHHLGQMLDTIILSPEGETVDANTIDFSGQIWNPDGTPCANQLVELHSDPMRTRTDSEGIFFFRGVLVGTHQLSMLDDDGQVQSETTIQIERDSAVSYGVVEQGEAVIHLRVSERAVEMHIQIRAEADELSIQPEVYIRKPGESFRDATGKERHETATRQPETIPESGEGLVDQENHTGLTASEGQTASQSGDPTLAESETGTPDTSETTQESTMLPTETSVESTLESVTESTTGSSTGDNSGGSSGSGDSGSSGNRPTKPTEPTEPETKPSEPETKPSEPETKPTEPETKPSEPETKPTEPETDPVAPLDVSVQEKSGPVWTQNTIISLFADRTGTGAERKLMPGSKGTYAFLVKNNNTYRVTYRMQIAAPRDQLLLPLRYRLKSGGAYLCGDSKTWLTAEQLSTASVSLEPGIQKEYLLEWQWLYEGGDDAYDTRIGSSQNLEYQVIVTIIIEQTVS